MRAAAAALPARVLHAPASALRSRLCGAASPHQPLPSRSHPALPTRQVCVDCAARRGAAGPAHCAHHPTPLPLPVRPQRQGARCHGPHLACSAGRSKGLSDTELRWYGVVWVGMMRLHLGCVRARGEGGCWARSRWAHRSAVRASSPRCSHHEGAAGRHGGGAVARARGRQPGYGGPAAGAVGRGLVWQKWSQARRAPTPAPVRRQPAHAPPAPPPARLACRAGAGTSCARTLRRCGA